MTKTKIQKIIKIIGALFFVVGVSSCLAAEDGVVISQVVEPACNNNSVCEENLGETYFTCPSDCESEGPLCNNNSVCEENLGETAATCPSDCEESTPCNSNGICEPSLGETNALCPSECGGGTIHPAVVQNALEGEPIEISNIKVSTGIGATTITWDTNKPTNTTLIFGYGREGNEEVYIDKFFIKNHSIRIDNLNFRKEYFFKIFSEGIYGDNNFGYAELFIIRQFLPDKLDKEPSRPEGNKGEEKMNNLNLPETAVGSKTIETSDEESEYTIIPPSGGVCEDDICGFESFGQFWGDFKCTIEKSGWFLFLKEYFWQVILFIIIIFFSLNLFRIKKK